MIVSFGLLHRLRRGHWPRWESYGYDFLTPLYSCRLCHDHQGRREMTDRPTPESEALLAEMRERYAWWPADEGTRVANILAAIEAAAIAPYREALIWCSGSPSFAPEGEAREGWERICQPLLAPDAPEAQTGHDGCTDMSCPFCHDFRVLS